MSSYSALMSNFCRVQPVFPVRFDLLEAQKPVGKKTQFFYKKGVGESMKYIPKVHRILAVDGNIPTLDILSELLSKETIKVVQACTVENALRIVESQEIHLLITDFFFLNGIGTHIIKKFREKKQYPVIMMSETNDRDIKMQSLKAGANMFIVKPFGIEIKMIVDNLINLMEAQEELENASDMVHALATAVEKKDAYTQGHHFRVTSLSEAIYDEIFGNNHPEERKALRVGCMLHDIGKIGVPDFILKSKNSLSMRERKKIEKHPIYGHTICKDLKTLKTALPIIRHHHEKLDGSGYPDGLRGNQISNIVAISTVADIFDALTSRRSYRKKNTSKGALEILKSMANRGKVNSFFVDTLEKIILKEGGLSSFFQIFTRHVKSVR